MPDGVPPVDVPVGSDADSPVPVPIAYLREAHDQFADANHSTVSVAITGQVAGNANIAVVSWYMVSANLDSFGDTAGNNYTLLGEISNGTITQRVYVAAPIAAAPTNTLTATWSVNAQFPEIRVLEYAGIAAASTLDQLATNVGDSANPTVGPIATTNANDLILGVFTGKVDTPGPNYTERIDFLGDYVEDRIASATGSFTAPATGMSGPYVAQIVALRGAL